MNHSVRFGAVLHQSTSLGTLLKRWEYLDSLAFDHLWITDHFNPFWAPDSDWFDAWVLLSALASHTRYARLGALVTPVAYRNPALLAQMAMTLDHICEGRLELALGSGASEDLSYTMLGIALQDPRTMVERTREAVLIIDQLMRTGNCTYHGDLYQIEKARVSPLPLQRPRPPITIAAHRPLMMQVAATYADTWNTHVGTVRGAEISTSDALAQLKHRVSQFETACLAVGRASATVRRSVMILAEWKEFGASASAFRENVYRYRELGFTDFVIPGMEETPKAESILKAIAHEEIPNLRNSIG